MDPVCTRESLHVCFCIEAVTVMMQLLSKVVCPAQCSGCTLYLPLTHVICSQVNPLAETDDGQLIAADAKLGFDDNAAFRQKDVFAMRDTSQEDPRCHLCLATPLI